MREILVDFDGEQTRTALVEDGKLVEIYFERAMQQRLVGNIYKGRVENVLPGMQAAFVNIGLEKNAFLYVGDAVPQRSGGEDGYEPEIELKLSIQDVLKVGQEVMIQVMKEPVGNKGARITTNITLPGRYVVLMPAVDYIGISRRIELEDERERLRELAQKIKPEGIGLIVRTVAEGQLAEDLEQDVKSLAKLWKKIQSRAGNHQAPYLIHRELELMQRIVRDLFNEETAKLSVNNRAVYERLLEVIDVLAPGFSRKVFLVDRTNLFEDYAIEAEIQKALKRKVWLKSGGYLVIDQTEALTVIDVNTGKYVGSTCLEDTVVSTNLEAAVELAHQIRLRDIGGIIIVDFIDMIETEHRTQVLEVLEEACRKDKTKTNVLGLTQLGLVELTRKKSRHSLQNVLTRICPYCEGAGRVVSEETAAINIKQELLRKASTTLAPGILIEAHPFVASQLIGPGGHVLTTLEEQTNKRIVIHGLESMHIENFELKVLESAQQIENTEVSLVVGQMIEVHIEGPHLSQLSAGIARVNGLVVNVEDGGAYVGQKILVEITKVQRTSAKARLVGKF